MRNNKTSEQSEPGGLSPRKSTRGLKPHLAASLIELLVVLFIMGIMMSLLFPALHRVRVRADETVCQNNLYQLRFGLSHFMEAKHRFPAPNQWTVDLLPWIEQRPLADVMKHGYSAGANFPRPPLMACPFQSDFASRYPEVSYCHFVLVVDRDEKGWPIPEQAWTLSDRPLLSEAEPQEPWYVGAEMTHLTHQRLLTEENGPHPGGRYDFSQSWFGN
jgi:type II secretory pathway pseudopilin PulG